MPILLDEHGSCPQRPFPFSQALIPLSRNQALKALDQGTQQGCPQHKKPPVSPSAVSPLPGLPLPSPDFSHPPPKSCIEVQGTSRPGAVHWYKRGATHHVSFWTEGWGMKNYDLQEMGLIHQDLQHL